MMPFGVEHLRADGDAQHGVLAVRAVLPSSAARTPTARRVLPPRPERRQVAKVGVGNEHDVPAVAAVTPVRPTSGHVLLAPEAERAVTTTPGDRGDAGAVVEHRCSTKRRRCGARRSSERDLAVAQREDRVVAAEAGARARLETCLAGGR